MRWPLTLFPHINYDWVVVTYWAFAILRVGLTLIPQTGYIHPDEFFQSTEILAGDIFELEVIRSWEFNVTFPIRSMLLSYITIGGPYMGIKLLNPLVRKVFEIDLITPYVLIVIPRLVIVFLSFVCDFCLYKISLLYNQNIRGRMLTLASSYVMLVYGARTLSNTLELIFLSLLLYFVTHSMCFTDDIIDEQDILDKKYQEARNMKERVMISRRKLRLPSHSIEGWIVVSLITVFGVFNRPTFIAFAFAPLFFWLQRAMDVKRIGFQHFHFRILSLSVGFLVISGVFILADSLYYGYITINELLMCKFTSKNFVIVPFNFILYNMNSKNLSQHGLHPWYLHIFVNVPLLFGILGLFGLLSFFENCYRAVTNTWVERPRLLNIFGLMASTFIIPIIVLSFIPHQEPRFILPVIIPLVFLQGHKLYIANQYQKPLLAVWFLFNIACVLFYGFLHQGGIYSALINVKELIELKSNTQYISVVFCNTYMPPSFLLLLPKLGRLSITSRGWKYVPPNRISLHDLAGTSLDNLQEDILNIRNQGDQMAETNNITHAMFLIMPTPRGDIFKNNFSKQFNLTAIDIFYPHISMEYPPWINDYPSEKQLTVYDFNSTYDFIANRLMQFSLQLYTVNYG